jgi:DNA-binding NtrC family response regulator
MGKKILIIDDDEQILDLLKMFLESNDHEVSTASSAEKGLAQVRKKAFDLILLDIMLPDEDGITVLGNMKKIVPNVPVIMITGGSDVEIAKECLKKGAVDYITKPFDFDYLRTAIIANMLGA